MFSKNKQAMILAAGKGSRMGDLCLNIPKPLLKINGKSFLEHHVIDLVNHGVSKIVVNVYYLADKIIENSKELAQKYNVEIIISDERSIGEIDTGGGIINALKYFGKDPFFVVSCDNYYNSKGAQLALLEEKWEPEKMRAVFNLFENKNSNLINGDFDLDRQDQIIRNESASSRKYIYISPLITDFRAFIGEEVRHIGIMKLFFDKFLKDDILEGVFGVLYPYKWCDLGNKESYLNFINKNF